MLRSADKGVLLAGRPALGLLSDAFRPVRQNKLLVTGGITGTSRGTTVTSGGSAHTKGAWVEFHAALPFTADGFWLTQNVSSARVRYWVDVGIGAAAAETVLVPDIPYNGDIGGLMRGSVYIPIRIPAGERVSLRTQASSAAAVGDFQITFVASEHDAARSCRRATAYGHVSASTSSVCLPDPNNTANVKGVYDELVASTTNPMKAWIFFLVSQSQDFASSRTYLTDLAVGAAASEVDVLSNIIGHEQSGTDSLQPWAMGPYWYPIPAGTRLSARMQSSAAADADFSYAYVLGFD